MLIGFLASRLGIQMAPVREGFSGQGDVRIGDTLVDITLFKSSKYTMFRCFTNPFDFLSSLQESLMNISGPSIVRAFRRSVESPSSMIILVDSLEHRVGTLSVKFGGSANGHNGVKSILAAMGGELGFHRFRIGVGRDGTDAAEYVMRPLSSYERTFWNEGGLDTVLREIGKVTLKTKS